MLIASFLKLVEGKWWNYTAEEYDAMEDNSVNVPILAIATTPTCPYCIKALPNFINFSETYKDADSYIFTVIDCTKSHVCARYGLKGVPTTIFIRGRDTRYWMAPQHQDYEGWATFLDTHGQLQINEIVDVQDLHSFDEQLRKGGTVFILSADRNQKRLIRIYKTTAKKYIHFGCKFIFKPSTENPALTAHLSETCDLTIPADPESIGAFIEEHKFSYFHKYSEDEFNKLKQDVPVVLSMSNGSLFGPHGASINRLSRQKCGQIAFGIVDMTQEKGLVEKFGMSIQHSPFYVAVNKGNGCSIASKTRLSGIVEYGVIKSVLKGENCGRLFPASAYLPEKPVDKLAILKFSTFFLSVVTLVKIWTRLFKVMDSKIE